MMMRIMVLGSTSSTAARLASQLAASRGLTLIFQAHPQGRNGEPLPPLGQELDQGRFILQEGTESPKPAALDLVIAIDATLEIPSQPPCEPDPLQNYYKGHGLLRRIRCEGEESDILATAERIIDDLTRTLLPRTQDPFDAALQAIASTTVPPEPVKSGSAEPPAEAAPTTNRVEPAAAKRPASGWKLTATKKGRLQRRHNQNIGRNKTQR